jgi:hypothetical protein
MTHMLFMCHLFNYSLLNVVILMFKIIEANHIRKSSLFSLFTLLGITNICVEMDLGTHM